MHFFFNWKIFLFYENLKPQKSFFFENIFQYWFEIYSTNFLFWLLILPLFFILLTFYSGTLFGVSSPQKTYNIALYCSASYFIISIFSLFFLNKSKIFFQAILNIPFYSNIPLTFGVDFISMSLIILTNLFIYLCILSIRIIEIRGKFLISELCNRLFFIQWGLVCAFSSLDLLGFFIFFEATLIPIFVIILKGGSRERRARASYLIAIYTLLGSIFMLYNIIYLFNKYGTTNYLILYSENISIQDQKILWITFFLAFAAKIPVFPFHIWLPEAHVEAPTIGSVLLAALLLKLGVYGLIRFGLPLFPYGQEYFKHIVVILTIASFFYTNLTAIRQVDIKKIIAYSSVVHMNLIVLGILCVSVESLDGAIYQMLAHGIVSGALFFCIGIIYERFKTRFLWYFGGIAFILPIYSIFLFLFILANISFPTTSNFIGEMLLFLGIFKDNFFIGIFAALSMFWGVIYNIWTYNRICFGNIKFNYNVVAKHHSPRILRNSFYNFNRIEIETIGFDSSQINWEYTPEELELIRLYKEFLIQEAARLQKQKEIWEQSIWYPYINPILDFIKNINQFLKTQFFNLKKFLENLWFKESYILTKDELELQLDKNFKINAKHLDIDYIDFLILIFLTIILFLTGIFSTIILDYISINSTGLADRFTNM